MRFEIQGKASGEVILLVDGIEGKIEILEVSGLPDSSYDLSIALRIISAAGNLRTSPSFQQGGGKNTRSWMPEFHLVRPQTRAGQIQTGRQRGHRTVFADKGIKAFVRDTTGGCGQQPSC